MRVRGPEGKALQTRLSCSTATVPEPFHPRRWPRVNGNLRSLRAPSETSVDVTPVTERASAPDHAHEPQTSLWSTVREALHGSRRDYTEGPVGRAILLLAI